MAEAYPIPHLDSRETPIDAVLTECPICLDQFQRPKSLPCLHSFCQECLDTFIKEHASGRNSVPANFPCPICRRETQPVDASEHHTRWAEQFPTNSLVVAILDMKDLRLSNKSCVPCLKRHNQENEAGFWCTNCNVFLCEDCRGVHDVFIEGHTVLTSKEIENDPTTTVTISAKCEKHDETMKLFCQDHKVVCCSMCVAVEHRKCDYVVTVKEQATEMNESKEAESLLTSISKDVLTLDTLLDDSQTNLEDLSNDKKRKIGEMAELRKQIDAHLDYLQKIDSVRLAVAVEKQDIGIKSRMKSVRNLKAAIEQSRKQIRAAEICMDDAQLVMTLQKVSSARQEYQQMIEETVSQHKRYKIGFEVNEAVKSMVDISTLAKVDEEFVRDVDPFQWFNKARLTNTVKIKPNSRTSGVLFWDVDTIITVDSNKMLSCYSTEGILEFDLKLDGKPWDVCKLNNSSIAVTMPRKKSIAQVEVREDEFYLTWNHQVNRKCYGIAHLEDKFLVTCPPDQEVLVLSNSGEIQSSILGNDHMWHATASKGSLGFIVSDRNDGKGETLLHRLDDKETMSSFFQSDTVSGGRGLDVDKFGNIYVCAVDDNKVLMVSPTGQSKIILSEEDGLNQPCAIGVYGHKMVVFEEKSDVGKVFQMLL